MKTVKLMLDYLQGPIWISDTDTGEPMTGIDIVDTDMELPKLNLECCELYSSCYEFDSHNQICWFNKEKLLNNKKRILYLLDTIKKRLDFINDGSYVVDDMETEKIRNIEKFD